MQIAIKPTLSLRQRGGRTFICALISYLKREFEFSSKGTLISGRFLSAISHSTSSLNPSFSSSFKQPHERRKETTWVSIADSSYRFFPPRASHFLGFYSFRWCKRILLWLVTFILVASCQADVTRAQTVSAHVHPKTCSTFSSPETDRIGARTQKL